MKNFVQDGDVLTLEAPAGGVVSGVGYLIGGLFVVATISAAEGELFTGRRRGVVELVGATHANAQAASAGDAAYWDNAAKKITKTAAGNTIVGVFVEDKVSADDVAVIVIVPRLVAPGAAIADLAGGADLAATIAKVNAIIAALEAGGVILA